MDLTENLVKRYARFYDYNIKYTNTFISVCVLL